MKDDHKTKKQLIDELTELRSRNGALKKSESEENFRAIFDRASDGILIADAVTKKLLQGNTTLCSMLGCTKEEIKSLTIYDIHPPNDVFRVPDEFEKLLKGEKALAEELPVLRKNGTIFYANIVSSPITFRGIPSVVCILRDITDRKLAEASLKEKLEDLSRLATVVSDSNDAVIMHDLDGKILAWNRGAKETYGYTETEALGKNVRDIVAETDREAALTLIQKIKQGEIVKSFELRRVTKDGRILDVWLTTTLLTDEKGKPVAIATTERDITDRKRAEEALRESEETYRLVVDNMADVISVMDMNLHFTYVSPSIMRMRGYTAEEAVAQTFEQIMTPESLQIITKVFEEEIKLEASGTADPGRNRIMELEEYRKDGSIVWIENSLSYMRDKAQKPLGIISLSRDITERKQAEEKLKDTLESLRKAFGATIQVMVSSVEIRDPYTAGHQIRSADLARAIATEMGLPREKIEGIRMAGSIHDIGKLSVPAEILSKPGKLSEIEFSLVKEHARKGYEMLKDVESPWPLAQIVYQHHERMNGSGYPRNLKGDEILLEARIMAVADVVESMASHRPYRHALGIEVALEEIEKNKGILYDNAVADACLKLFREKGFKLDTA